MGSYFYAYTWFCFYNYGASFGGPSDRRSSANIDIKIWYISWHVLCRYLNYDRFKTKVQLQWETREKGRQTVTSRKLKIN